MAKVTVTLPPVLKDGRFADSLLQGVWTAVQDTGQDVLTEAKAEAPADRGAMARGLRWKQSPRRSRGNVSGRLVAIGNAAAYADVQDRGRRAGQRGPGTRNLLYRDGVRQGPKDTGRTGWVGRVMADAVNSLATKLKAEHVARLKTKKRTKRKIAAFRGDARFLLARAVSRKIHRVGMPGKRYVPDARRVARVLKRRIGQNFGQIIAAAGLGGRR